ncbi:hypothetical protein ACM66B_004095 [Microbotryomycetes sp. NB124-2]
MAPRGGRGGRGRGGSGRGGQGPRKPQFFQGQGHVLGSSLVDDVLALSSSSSSASRGARGGATRAARGTRGSSRGGTHSGHDRRDYTEMSFNYGDLNELDLAPDSVNQLRNTPSSFVGPSAKQQRQQQQQQQQQQRQPLLPPSETHNADTSDLTQDNSQPPSGTTTPHTGIGAYRLGGPSSKVRAGLGASRPANTYNNNNINGNSNNSLYTSKYRYGNEYVVGIGGGKNGFRPLLQPVAFVKASGLTPSLDADDSTRREQIDVKDTMRVAHDEQPGELEDHVFEGQLVEEVRDLALDDEETAGATAMADDAAGPDHSVMDGNDDAEPSFVIDTVGEAPRSDATTTHATTPSFVLGTGRIQSRTQDSDDDDVEEEIVFKPQSQSRASGVVQDTFVSTPHIVIETRTTKTSIEIGELSSLHTEELVLPTGQETGQPKLKLAAAPKLSKSQKTALKKAGKKARKQGKTHSRSGNRHLIVSDDDEDELEGEGEAGGRVLGQENDEDQDLNEGRAMFDRMKQDGVMNVDSDYDEDEDDVGGGPLQDESQMRIPRQGDSDLEWGSDGPPPVTKRLTAQEKKNERRQQRSDQRELDRMERLSRGARIKVERQVSQRSEDKKKQVAVDDYVKNVLDMTDKDLETMGISLDQAKQFVKGMMGPEAGEHKTLQGLMDDDNEAVDNDVEAWQTDSEESEEGDGSVSEDESESTTSGEEFDSDDELERDHVLGEADALVELALEAGSDEPDAVHSADYLDSSISSGEEDAILQAALMSGKTIRLSSMGKSGPGGRRDRKERQRARKGKGKAVEFDVDDSEDDDDDEAMMFSGKSKWDDDMMAVVDDVIDSRDRKARNKLFKAISEGDFESFADDYDDFSFSAASKPKGKGKNKVKPSFEGDFALDLDAQWAKDRQKKSIYKRERAAARAAATQPQSGNNKVKSRKGGKKAINDEFEADESDAQIINVQIRQFLMHNLSETQLSLPPMSKKSRVAVHLLAEVYGLKSKSVGKGSKRFPVLERTSKSTVFGVDERKVRAIVGTARGEREVFGGRGGGVRATGKMGGLWAALSGESGGAKKGRGGGGGSGGARHSEGAVVGQGADRLGEDNIGFALLKRMGWTEGQKIGAGAGGLAEPIPARIKTSKSGLGSGYAVSMSEAYKMARSNSEA